MQVRYINIFNQAKQYQTANPVASGIILLLILVLLPLAIILALGVLVLFLVYAKMKTFIRSLLRAEGQPRIKVSRKGKVQEPEYAEYEIIEDK